MPFVAFMLVPWKVSRITALPMTERKTLNPKSSLLPSLECWGFINIGRLIYAHRASRGAIAGAGSTAACCYHVLI